MSLSQQKHLNRIDTINYGSYYTPKNCVDIVYDLLFRYVNINDFKLLDTSCGYGSFLRYNNSIGADIDKIAIEKAKQYTNCIILEQNALLNVCRNNYNIKDSENLIIIGNPPYNDKTSIINNKIKKEVCKIDTDLIHRDTGCSFILSYAKLKPEYVCILHPLSYLIKLSNFNSLKTFYNNYKLVDSVVISSAVFSNTSTKSCFPIIIALYKRDETGMNFDYVKQYKFKTIDNKNFALNDFDVIDNYITKYPNKKYIHNSKTFAYFYTMRDINALKRSKTFLEKEITNAININIDDFAYYCYVDCFKDEIKHIPYYFGNCNIPINNKEFLKIKDYFIEKSCKKYSFLQKLYKNNGVFDCKDGKIQSYFTNLLGEHYVY